MHILKITFFGIACFLFQQVSAQDQAIKGQNVLFVGNSMTKYEKNHTLEILKTFLIETKSDIIIDDFTMNGSILGMLLSAKMTSKRKGNNVNILSASDLSESDLYAKINQGNYDLIITQHDSHRYLSNLPQGLLNFYESLPVLDSLAKSKSSDLVVFENYSSFTYKESRKADDNYFASEYDFIISSKDTLKKILPNLKFIPTGYIIKEYRQAYPNAKYTTGHGHPSKNLQFLLACVFYKYLTGKNADTIEYNYKLNPDDANAIKQLADRTYATYCSTYNE